MIHSHPLTGTFNIREKSFIHMIICNYPTNPIDRNWWFPFRWFPYSRSPDYKKHRFDSRQFYCFSFSISSIVLTNIPATYSDLLQFGKTETKHIFSLCLPIGETGNCPFREILVAFIILTKNISPIGLLIILIVMIFIVLLVANIYLNFTIAKLFPNCLLFNIRFANMEKYVISFIQ